MRRITTTAAALIALALVLTPATSSAQQQMTIQVPVTYENFDPSWKIKAYVYCDVGLLVVGEPNWEGGGYGQNSIEFTGGKYSGTVPVVVTVNPGPRPNRYHCYSRFTVVGISSTLCSPWPVMSQYPCKTGCTAGLNHICEPDPTGDIP